MTYWIGKPNTEPSCCKCCRI